MKQSRIIAFCCFFFLIWQNLHSEDSSNNSSCITCHQDVHEATIGSVHDSAGISCHDCHGGDPTKEDYELSMSTEAGFIGVPNKKQIALMCGKCHADVEFMNFYGIRTDQLARYRTSTHGKQVLEEDNSDPATCTDCHGHHNIVSVKDPNSLVYPTNLPQTCNKCHGDKTLMDSYGLPSDVFDKYRKSVHGVALFEKGDTGAAQCASCHGGHGAVPPGVKNVSSTCGKCHINEKKYFLESPHAKLAEAGALSECDSCHGHHDVKPATVELYQKVCVECHEEGSPQAKQGSTIYEMLKSYQNSLDSAEKVVRQASIEGIFVEEEESALEEIKTNVLASEPEQHSLSIQKISKHRKAVVGSAEEVISKIHEKRENLKWRKWALYPIWIFVLVMMIALWVSFKRLKAHKKTDSEDLLDKEKPDADRRDFLGRIIKGGLVATLVGFAAPAITYLWPVIRRGPVSSQVEVGKVEDFAMWGSKKVAIGGSPVLVIRTPKGFSALSAICTHLGCVVAWNGQRREIACPCHAGFFDVNGKVLSGPPPRALPAYSVKVIDGKVFVIL